ncbi:SgcJ/EcaC family oxidoreductase [Pseudomonas sp. NPDC089554]|uniref:SgcJ/EcaC family oxidoreductase n=1 Tax=Pseudomonas sp. NPDC089554 TaxID=3390653 RepID=UPI003D01E00D
MPLVKHVLPLALFACALQAQAAPTHCQALDRPQALDLFKQWNDSLQSRDAAKVAALYSDDAVLLPTVSKTPRLTPEARVDYFRHFLREGPSGSLDSHHLQVGCNVATLAGLYTFQFADTGKQVAARYTFTYHFDGQRWLISQHHSSLLPTS